VSEYLLEKVYPHWYKTRVPLGPALPGTVKDHGLRKALRISRPWRPEVDAVALVGNHLVLIEAKLLKIVDGLAKLPLYKSLVPTTPELQVLEYDRVIMRLVAPWTSETMEIMASGPGIEIEVFEPEWIVDYMADQHNYWTAEYRAARAEKRRLRESLGVD